VVPGQARETASGKIISVALRGWMHSRMFTVGRQRKRMSFDVGYDSAYRLQFSRLYLLSVIYRV